MTSRAASRSPMVWASSRAFKRRTHSPSRQVVPAVTPTPIRETPAEDEPMQVSVRVEVRAGAAMAGADRIVWVEGEVLLNVMFCDPAFCEEFDCADEVPVPPEPPAPPVPPDDVVVLLPEFDSLDDPPAADVLTLLDELPELLFAAFELPVVLPLFDVLVLPTDELPVVFPVLVVLPCVLPLEVDAALLLADDVVLLVLALPLLFVLAEFPASFTEPP